MISCHSLCGPDSRLVTAWRSDNGIGRISEVKSKSGLVSTGMGDACQRSYSTSGPVNTGMGDHLWAGKPPHYATSQPDQVSLLPSVGWEMDTGQSMVMLCGWGVKAGWLIPCVDKRHSGW